MSRFPAMPRWINRVYSWPPIAKHKARLLAFALTASAIGITAKEAYAQWACPEDVDGYVFCASVCFPPDTYYFTAEKYTTIGSTIYYSGEFLDGSGDWHVLFFYVYDTDCEAIDSEDGSWTPHGVMIE